MFLNRQKKDVVNSKGPQSSPSSKFQGRYCRQGKGFYLHFFIFLGSKITVDGDCSHKIKTLAPWKKNYDKLGQHVKKQRHYFANRGPSSQSRV